MMPVDITDVDAAFPAHVRHLMPPMADIPEPFQHGNAWTRLASSIFFKGANAKAWKAKPGIDKLKALRHIMCVLGSFEPAHEHKIAAVGYLLSQWFEPIKEGA
jgi:hypothetical protein